MRRALLGIGLLTGLTGLTVLTPAKAATPVPQGPIPSTLHQAWAPACHVLSAGNIVRSARPVKEGAGSDKRRFWRGHWRVTQVLNGGRFLAAPLYRKEDGTGEIRRGAFDPFPGETARTPPGALMCEAFVSE